MGKRGMIPGFGGLGGLNINKLMKEAQNMQNSLKQSQKEIEEKVFETTAGGGAVKGKMSGDKTLLELKINEELLNPEEKEMLEDIIVVAVNDLLEKIKKEEDNMTSGLNIPGMGLGL